MQSMHLANQASSARQTGVHTDMPCTDLAEPVKNNTGCDTLTASTSVYRDLLISIVTQTNDHAQAWAIVV